MFVAVREIGQFGGSEVNASRLYAYEFVASEFADVGKSLLLLLFFPFNHRLLVLLIEGI